MDQETGPGNTRPAMVQHSARPRRRWWWVQLLVWAAVITGGWWSYPWLKPRIGPWLTQLTGGESAPAVKPPPKVAPVLAVAVRQGDLPIYLNALGTVTGYKTVTIRSRVEGELIDVHFTEGQLVSEGDLLAEIDPRPFEVQLKQAQAQLLKDKAALRAAMLDYNRYEKLVANNTVTQQQLDATRSVVQQAQGAIQADEALIEQAELQLTYCKITAPVNGRIGLRTVDQGNIVRANDVTGLAVISQLRPITVVFPIPQDEIVRVQRKVNEGETLIVEAYDRSLRNKLATGELLAIDNQVDSTTGTVRIKARFENHDNLLFPNQFVNARLLVETRRNVVMAPSSAVQRGPDSHFVYVVQTDSTVELRKIKVGPSEGDQTLIEDGLAAGEEVVTDGLDKLQSGAKVAVRGKEPSEKQARTPTDTPASQTGDQPADSPPPSPAKAPGKKRKAS